jgi:signal transduction histidine kinase
MQDRGVLMAETRETGIDVVGNLPWGSHFCFFYERQEDLLDTLVPYCKAGLENDEFCLWVVSEPVGVEDARQALKRAVPDFDRYEAEQSIEIVSAGDWYLQGGSFDLRRVTDGWQKRLVRALTRGYAGVRVTGDTAWLEKKDWKDFCEYEEGLNECVANQCLTVLCTYPLAACGAAEILDVVQTHQFAIAKRHGRWDIVETAGHKQAKAEIKRLNEQLEQRVVERTSQLIAVNEALRKEIVERERAEQARTDLAGRLIHAQEEERSRIGRELHDHIIQALGLLTIKIDRLIAGAPTLPADLAKVLYDLRQITDDVHRLSHRLHSSTLDILGLAPALTKLVDEFAERHHISIEFVHVPLPPSLPSEVALCLYRITEESLTNIAKHSKAGSAQVRVSTEPENIHLTVKDAGVGFDARRLEGRAGLGLVSMQERVRLIRGTIRVDSTPAQGTSIDVWVPSTSPAASMTASSLSLKT